MAQEILAHTVEAQHGDKESTLFLINKFEPILKRCASSIKREDAYNDLVVFFISAIQTLNWEGIKNKEDSGLVKYLCAIVVHEYVRISKKQRTYEQNTYLLEDVDESAYSFTNRFASETLHDVLFYYDLSIILTEAEVEVVNLHYFSGFSIQEIADMRKTSRQAVNKIRTRALNKLKTNYYDQ